MQQQSIPDVCFDRRAIPAAALEGWWSAPDGQRIRRIDWNSQADPVRGSLLFLPGRADFYEKYLDTLDHWFAMGWNVTSIDWRGQGLSGRLGDDLATGHVDDFGVWVSDLAQFWAEWRATQPSPHVLVGHSMGGHIVLRALAMGLVKPDAAVLVAPMLGFLPQHAPPGLLHGVARAMAWLRGAKRSAWKGSEKPGRLPDDRFDLLTHDSKRYADEIWWRKERPQLALGPPSWGWIESALASMRLLDQPGLLESIESPVCILSTDADALVSPRATQQAAQRIRDARTLTFGEEARHEILREEDPIRDRAITAIDGFFGDVAPAAGNPA